MFDKKNEKTKWLRRIRSGLVAFQMFIFNKTLMRFGFYKVQKPNLNWIFVEWHSQLPSENQHS